MSQALLSLIQTHSTRASTTLYFNIMAAGLSPPEQPWVYNSSMNLLSGSSSIHPLLLLMTCLLGDLRRSLLDVAVSIFRMQSVLICLKVKIEWKKNGNT